MEPDRKLIDPDDRYPADGLTSVEQAALAVLEVVPDAQFERTRDVFQFEHGGDKGIVVVVTPEAIELRLPTVEWTMGAYGPAPSSRLWKRLDTNDDSLKRQIRTALRARARQFRTCRFCEREFPPEYGFEKDVCQGCASQHLGVVY